MPRQEGRNEMTNITAAGYMIQDKQGYAIHGIGATVDEAWAEVVANAGPFTNSAGDEITADEAFKDFKVYGATAALIAQVKDEGGAIAWDVIGGVACTRHESEAE